MLRYLGESRREAARQWVVWIKGLDQQWIKGSSMELASCATVPGLWQRPLIDSVF
jgi:hypothetical protein